MKSLVFCFTLLSTIAISIAASLPAQAQRARVFVSVTGNDANPCTAGSPCKTFQAAHDAVLAGGEISVLDTGGYGTLIINKAVSIVAVGVQASIAIPSGGTGVTINAGSTDKVSLRGLTLDGQGVSADGIDFNSGGSLTMDDCVVRNMGGEGLHFISTAASDEDLDISNSSFFDNGANGIVITTESSGNIHASIDRTLLHGNTHYGMYLVGNNGGDGILNVTVTDSVASNNSTNPNMSGGFRIDGGAFFSNLFLTRTVAQGNLDGVVATGGNGVLWLAQSTVSQNKRFGFSVGGVAVIKSYSDNYMANNGNNIGALTGVTKQ
jgi:hypothetical protein